MPTIAIDRLQPGIYISLDGIGWMEHPFLLNHFRITTQQQIGALRRMGLTEVQWDPARSTVQPLPAAAVAEAEPDFGAGALDALLSSKRDRVERVREQRETLARCARLYEQETKSIRQILGSVAARPNDAHSSAKTLTARLVEGLVNAKNVAVHLVNLKSSDTGIPGHSMNVMVISLLIGKAVGLSADELKELGLGAMLHDIGKEDVPSRVLRNPNRTPAEEQFYRGHTGFGIKSVAGIRDLATSVRNVIACHHERWDGNGFPNRLTEAKIPKLARIVAIANRYDNLCNPIDPKDARTPAQAVAAMFKDAGGLDPELLRAFVKALGIYPPGSFVTLDDGSIGLVMETNDRDLLRPLLMIYDAGVPRSEALLLDMRDAEAKIEGTVNPQDLPRAVVEYLAPQGRIELYITPAT